MSRVISHVALGSFLILHVTSLALLAVEKNSKESPAATKARQEVKAALQAEASGDNDQRAARLASAIATSPDLAEANWQLTKVLIGDKWLTLAEAEQHAAADLQLAEYRKLRDEAGDNPRLIRGLARWCLKNGWDDAARLHYAQLLASSGADLDAKEEAIRRLGLSYINGNWVTAADLAQQLHRAKAIEESLTKWRPRLKRLQTVIDGSDFARRASAIKELEQLDDPQLIPVLESFLVDGEDRFQEEAAKKLAMFSHCEATNALVYYAVLSPYLAARETAAKALENRSVFEYCPLLLGGLVAPLQTQFQVTAGRGDRILYRHVVRQQTPQLDRVAIADTISLPMAVGPQLPRGPESAILRREFVGQQVDMLRDAAQAAELQVAVANAGARSNNRRVAEVLRTATGQQLGDEPQAWWDWWQDYNQKWWPQVSQYIYGQQQCVYPAPQVRHSCFVAGTLVHTQTGMTPIETIKPGDRVLSQDQDTGELSYKLISATTIRPPANLLRIRAASEAIDTTLGHPFWVTGVGWKMAKELHSGDFLHSLSGALPIDSVEELADKKAAYNLVVQDFNTYFVGKAGLLVHDNEFRKPTRATVPGLVVEPVAVASSSKK